MASATDTARAEPSLRARLAALPFVGSRLGRLIVALNMLGLLILIGGALILNESRQGLIKARIESLTAQGELIANLIEEAATRGTPEPALEAGVAGLLLQKNFVPKGQRARLFDTQGNLIADSYLVSDAVEVTELPPARKPGEKPRAAVDPAEAERRLKDARTSLNAEIDEALEGRVVAKVRPNETGRRVVSVAVPVQRVKAVLGVLVLEAGDVDAIVAAQRRALVPFALVALGVTLVSSLLLHFLVTRPILRLSRAADEVRLAQARAISLPDLTERKNEIGDLARSLERMTEALATRINAIERFAADVSHEIKNPLTSVRSAVETLEFVKDPAAKERLLQLLKQDVRRMDRLITDISNFSRLDAELSRDAPHRIDLSRLMEEIANLYAATVREGESKVSLTTAERFLVSGQEGLLAQVFRNLIDNARSFSAPWGEVRVSVVRDADDPATPVHVRVEDDGPGIPPENLETVFERFYTSRPKGTAFGTNSGLGLSIARQIVAAHGGRVWAENRVADEGRIQGARFVVALPEART